MRFFMFVFIMKCYLFLFIVAIIFTSTSGNTGRIIGGYNASEGAFPYMVSVWTRLTATSYSFCGGAILNQYWILSAAHCGPATFVQVGNNDLIKQEQTYLILTRIRFNYNNITHENDIQLLRTFRKIVMTPGQVAPISIYTESIPNDAQLTLSGWGWFKQDQLSMYLQVLNYTYFNQSTCSFFSKVSPSQGSDLYFVNSDMCAMPNTVRTGACYGDSGGPLVYNGKVVGVVSRGMALSCACGYPDIFANVPNFASKIASVIAK